MFYVLRRVLANIYSKLTVPIKTIPAVTTQQSAGTSKPLKNIKYKIRKVTHYRYNIDYTTYMLAPKRTKYRKQQKGRLKNIAHNLNGLQFGKYGLKSLERGVISAATIEAVRRSIRRDLRRSGILWIRLFPDLPITRKPAEVRMGKGKGNTSFWVCKVRPGQILYEMDGIPLQTAKRAAQQVRSKLPFKTSFVLRGVHPMLP